MPGSGYLGTRGGIGISQIEERAPRQGTAKPFKIAAIIAAVLLGVLSFSLVSLATAWFGIEERAGHEVHDLSWGILGGLILTGALVLQIKDPGDKVATMQAFVLTVSIMSIVLAIADPSPLILVFLGVTALLVYLHPARSRLVELGEGWQPVLAGLAIIGAIPLMIYALDQIDIQRLDIADDLHWEEGHFGQMAAWAVAMPALALLTARRTPGWIWVARGAALGTLLMGLISLIYPDNLSSLGTAWGTAAVVGALVFAVAAEMDARSGGETAAERVTASSDPP